MGNSFSLSVNLPRTLFLRGQEPNQGAVINNYGSLGVIFEVELLVGEAIFNRIKGTFLGPIMNTKRDGLAFSAKVVHYILCRQLVTNKNQELWFYFGGQPLRFLLREFHMVTELPCRKGESTVAEGHTFSWPELSQKHDIKDIKALIQEESRSDDEKFSLGMLMIIEGVFLQKYYTYQFPASNVEIARNVNTLMNHAWGKDAYDNLLESVKKITKLGNLSKPKYELHGFPLAIQLWVLVSVPKLEERFSKIDVLAPINGIICQRYRETECPSIKDIAEVESNNGIKVTCILPPLEEDPEDSVSLDDEDDDDLNSIVETVIQGYRITTTDWERGSVDIGWAMEEIYRRNRFSAMRDEATCSEMPEPAESLATEIKNLLKIVSEGFTMMGGCLNTIDGRLDKLEEKIEELRANKGFDGQEGVQPPPSFSPGNYRDCTDERFDEQEHNQPPCFSPSYNKNQADERVVEEEGVSNPTFPQPNQ